MERNRLEINADNTKIMIFRNRGRRKVGEKWKVNSKDLKIVNEYKYLGFWFSTKEDYFNRIQKLVRKARPAASAEWGILRRAIISNLGKRLYIMDEFVTRQFITLNNLRYYLNNSASGC